MLFSEKTLSEIIKPHLVQINPSAFNCNFLHPHSGHLFAIILKKTVKLK